VAKLATGRQRQLAIDFAANQRFRRDVFVRGHESLGQEEASRHLRAAAIGSLGNPERIGTKARVPRGEIRFHEDFILGLQSLMVRGSTTIGQAVNALGGEGRDPVDIARNLIFLVAAGMLMPFAKARDQSRAVTARRVTNRTVERALANVIEHRAPRAIPSETLGNGVDMLPIEALAITEWLAGADGVETLAPRLEAGVNRLKLTITSDGRELQRGELAAYARVAAQGVIENLLPTLMRLGLIV
jgi:hypothetical protein